MLQRNVRITVKVLNLVRSNILLYYNRLAVILRYLFTQSVQNVAKGTVFGRTVLLTAPRALPHYARVAVRASRIGTLPCQMRVIAQQVLSELLPLVARTTALVTDIQRNGGNR